MWICSNQNRSSVWKEKKWKWRRSENFPILWFWLEAKPLIKFSIPKIVCHSNASTHTHSSGWSGQFPKTKGESVIGTPSSKPRKNRPPQQFIYTLLLSLFSWYIDFSSNLRFICNYIVEEMASTQGKFWWSGNQFLKAKWAISQHF